jgi:hypothetical protein
LEIKALMADLALDTNRIMKLKRLGF